MTNRNHYACNAIRALLPVTTMLLLGAVGCTAGQDGGEKAVDPGPKSSLDDLSEQERADIVLLREAIGRGLHLGKTTLTDEINVAMGDHGISEHYVSSIDSGVDYVPPNPSNSCEFLETNGTESLDCRVLVTFATVSAYARTPGLRADDPLGARFDLIRAEGEFWYGEGTSSGIDNEATLAVSGLRALGVCDQDPTPAKSAYEAGVEHGRQLYIGYLNERLSELGYNITYPDIEGQIELCDPNTVMLDPALTRALSDADTYAVDNRLCPTYQPDTLEEIALRDDVDQQFRLGIDKGASTEHSLAEEAIFKEVPCNVSEPLVVDVAGDGVSLEPLATSQARFDLYDNGRALPTSWIRGDDAWLVLDRNGNGSIDNGRELFGNYVGDKGYHEVPTGFEHLARYDRTSEGGNGDGIIDARDAIFSRLRLWQDGDGDGQSRTAELHRLGDLGVEAIRLSYAKYQGGDPQLSHRAVFVRTAEGKSEHGSPTAHVYDAWLRHGRSRIW